MARTSARIDRALMLAMRFAQTGHETWVIDQMVRELTGHEYEAWVRRHNKGDDGPDTYEWDEGIAP